MDSIRFTCLIAYSSDSEHKLAAYNSAVSEASSLLRKYGIEAANFSPLTGLWQGEREQGLRIEILASLENPKEDGPILIRAFKACIEELKALWNQEAALFAEDNTNCLLL